MGKTNHKGIPVKSSTYPEDWNPSSMSSYNKFMTHVVLQNLMNEGRLENMPAIYIDVRTSKPEPIGLIIRKLLSNCDEFQMIGLLNQASEIINGGGKC
ncbi:hypothetical protein [Sphingobacterium suaedae]|uniref:Uncharacterized protein n=1 Tax=Sphingobacterium suaedae TaxID=1686402 RepID=A0ABW5KHE8_9SPHI